MSPMVALPVIIHCILRCALRLKMGSRSSSRFTLLARIRKRGFLSERRFAEGLSVGEQAAAGPSGVSLPGIRGSQEEAVAT